MRYDIKNDRKVHFVSLGCARNLVDTEVMLGILLKNGYQATNGLEEADYFVVNTCGFLESARDEAYRVLEELFEKKKEGAKVVVAGCMVRLHRDPLKERFPGIHYFLGAGDVDKILEAITAEESGEIVGDAKSYLQMGEIPRVLSTPKHYAYLKIAEGCKKRCAFCIIPNIKGKLVSKAREQVIREFQALVKGGAKEIILIAQDLGDYGKDFGEREGLYTLLKELDQIEGNHWIRLLYLYPDEMSNEIIHLMKESTKIVPYVDMPIQHINDRVLKAMHRKTSRQQILSMIQTLRTEIPHIVLRTSIMVGFPGETEEEFQELCEFVKETKLDNVGFFKYSREEESYSATLEGHIDEETKERRYQTIVAIQEKVAKEVWQKWCGKRTKVLIEGYHPESKDLLVGRFYGQCPEIDGQVILNQWDKVKSFGDFYEVEIEDAYGYDLVGRVLAKKHKVGLCLIGQS